jgi:hypothetical protein
MFALFVFVCLQERCHSQRKAYTMGARVVYSTEEVRWKRERKREREKGKKKHTKLKRFCDLLLSFSD